MTTGSRRGTAAPGTLDLAVLGMLADAPMHGYQLHARLTETLGPIRSYSYGSLYPALRRLAQTGHIAGPGTDPAGEPGGTAGGPGATARRTRVTYRLTPSGTRLLADLLADVGPSAATDEGFGVRLALFAHTPVDARLAVLRGRCHRLERQRDGLLASVSHAGRAPEDDIAALHRLTIAAHERELLWLRGLIAREQHRVASHRFLPSPQHSIPPDPPSPQHSIPPDPPSPSRLREVLR